MSHTDTTEQHNMAGRISGATGVATFCTCGRAYFAGTVNRADEAYRKHSEEERPRPCGREQSTGQPCPDHPRGRDVNGAPLTTKEKP